MVNLLKSEIYQLTHRKAPYIWLIVGLLFSSLAIIIPVIGMSLTNTYSHSPAELIVAVYSELVISSSTIILFGLVGTSFNNELKNRTLINTVSYGLSRRSIFMAKVFSAVLMTLAFLVVSFITFTLTFQLLFPGNLNVVLNALSSFGNYSLIWLAYLCLFVFVQFISETPMPSYITLALLLIVFPIISQLGGLFKVINTIKPYVLMWLSPSTDRLLLGLNEAHVVTFIYIIGFLIIGIRYFNRKEIK